MSYAIEMLNIMKEFPGIKANDNVTLQVEQGEITCIVRRKWCRKIDADVYFVWFISTR